MRLGLGTDDAEAFTRLRRAILDAPGESTPLAPVMRSESSELGDAIGTITRRQPEMLTHLDQRSLHAAADRQRSLDTVMDAARARWPLDPMIVNLDGYHLKNAYLLEHWDAIQAGVRHPRTSCSPAPSNASSRPWGSIRWTRPR